PPGRGPRTAVRLTSLRTRGIAASSEGPDFRGGDDATAPLTLVESLPSVPCSRSLHQHAGADGLQEVPRGATRSVPACFLGMDDEAEEALDASRPPRLRSLSEATAAGERAAHETASLDRRCSGMRLTVSAATDKGYRARSGALASPPAAPCASITGGWVDGRHAQRRSVAPGGARSG